MCFDEVLQIIWSYVSGSLSGAAQAMACIVDICLFLIPISSDRGFRHSSYLESSLYAALEADIASKTISIVKQDSTATMLTEDFF